MLFDATSTKRLALSAGRPSSSSAVRVKLDEAQKFRDKLKLALESTETWEASDVGTGPSSCISPLAGMLPPPRRAASAGGIRRGDAMSMHLLPLSGSRSESEISVNNKGTASDGCSAPDPIQIDQVAEKDGDSKGRATDPYPPSTVQSMKLEARRYDVEEQLVALKTVKADLERESRSVQASAALRQQADALELSDFRAAEDFVVRELAGEMAAHHAARLHEKEQRRLGKGPVVEKFTPKFVSSWTLVTRAPLVLESHSPPSSHRSATLFTRRNSKPQAAPGKRISIYHRRNYEEERFPDQATRDELLKMRSLEVLRCADRLEPSGRAAVDEKWRIGLRLMSSMEQLCHAAIASRSVTVYEERCTWLRLVQAAEGSLRHLQIALWHPAVTRDRPHFMRRIQLEVIPAEVGSSILQEASERHRQNIRDHWEVVKEVRSELLKTVQSRHSLRRDVSRWEQAVGDTLELPATHARRIMALQRAAYAAQALEANLQKEEDLQRRLQLLSSTTSLPA